MILRYFERHDQAINNIKESEMKYFLIALLLFGNYLHGRYGSYARKVVKTPICQPIPEPCTKTVTEFGYESVIDQYIFQRDEDGWNQLMYAAALDDTQQLSFILDHIEKAFGHDPQKLLDILTIADEHGRTALYLTAEWINYKSMNILLKYASRWFQGNKELFLTFLNAKEEHLQWTSLVSCVYASFSEGVRVLVEAAEKFFGRGSPEFKTFINAKTIFGRTPLAMTIEPWDRIYLEKHGAIREVSAEFTAHHHEDLKNRLLKYSAYEGFEKELEETLEEASKAYSDKYEYLLDFITARNGAGWTALMNAAADGNIHYVDLILAAANKYFKDKVWIAFIMNMSDVHGRTAWHLAISRRQVKVLERLIENQRSIAGNRKKPFLRIMLNRTELNGFTPLIAAAYEGTDDMVTFDMVKLLIHRMDEVLSKGSREFNIVINRRDFDGYTALSYAVTPGMKHFLKSYGATID